ncbi:MAG: SprT-like domain-containing protein [Polyangia bacterium]
MRDDALTAALEAALLRQLFATWRSLNDSYFTGRLRAPTLALADGAHKLGQWLAGDRRIELQRAFVVDGAWGAVVEVLKHEMAHQFVTEVLGDPDGTPHGAAFRAVCERHGIDASAAGVPDAAPTPDAERVLARVAKLLALAESPNVHEAELAMAEAQRLMLRHNVDATARASYSFRHLGAPTGRVSEAERILANILNDHFFVECIWVPVWRPRDGKRGSVLEVCGTTLNLTIAEHTHAFLLHTADRLWAQYKRDFAVGNRDRRTYQAGVMTGFREKLDAQRKQHTKAGLVWVGDGDLAKYWRRRHPHVRFTRHFAAERNEAHAHGRAAGRNIVLQRAMHERVSRGRLLPGRR